ncbi:MAG: hypothetical protein AB7T20_09010 [Steroidobacteraceae bacterium]
MIDRYLANRLPESEVTVVETRIVADPGFRNEVELTEALRDGLRELQSRGEITPLLSHRYSWWQRPRVALAASVAAIALGAASFLVFQRMDSGREEVLVASLRFEHLRSAGVEPDVVWQRTGVPTRLEMRFDIGLEPAGSYRVVIERITDGAAVRVLEAAATMTADGQATLAAESALFEPGDYEITLHPQPPAESREPVTYALRVAGQG